MRFVLSVCVALLVNQAWASPTQRSEVVKWSTTQTDTLASLTGTGADTSAAFICLRNMSMQVQVTTSNDSTNLLSYPIFSNFPHEGYRRETPAREPDQVTAGWTNTSGDCDSTDFAAITANGWSSIRPINVPVTMFCKIVVCGKTGNELSTTTKAKVVIAVDD